MTFFSRGKNKIQHPYCFRDMYLEYISDIDEGSPYYVTYKEYVDICSMFYKSLSKALIEDGIKFKFPFALGELYVNKHKLKYNSKLPIDWQLTVKEGKKVYNLNEHTAGFGYKFFWTKPYKVVNKFTYRLVFTRENKRHLAKAIKQYKKDYFEQ
jgi:hypothetical protein